MAKKKLSRCDAKESLKRYGINFNVDVNTLRMNDLNEVATVARRAGYRKPKNANCSTGCMYFNYLARISCKGLSGLRGSKREPPPVYFVRKGPPPGVLVTPAMLKGLKGAKYGSFAYLSPPDKNDRAAIIIKKRKR